MIGLETLTSAKLRRRALLIVTNSINSLILPIFNVAISFLVIRLASVELWGEFVNVLIIVNFGAHIISWGNKEYLLRDFSFHPARVSQSWQTSLVTRSVLLLGYIVVVSLLRFSPRGLLLIILWSLGLVLYQSHDVLIVYRRAFVFSAIVELCGLAFLIGTIAWLGNRISLAGLIFLFGVANVVKAGVFLLRFHQYTLQQFLGRFDIQYFRLAFPFFLLGFSGMLQSRIDLYSVNYFLPNSEVGQYQVFINLMIYLQSVSNFILVPFVKSIYRLSYEAILRISMRLFAFGLLIMAPALLLVHLALVNLYHFEISVDFLIPGGLLVLPVYFYLPIIYGLYKAGLQSMVLKINILGAGINFILNLLLLPRVGMIGAVMASATVQWLMFIAYLSQGRALRDDYPFTVPELS